MFAKLNNYVEELTTQFDSLSTDRREVLRAVADRIPEMITAEQDASLTFVCTHNSRRSHFAQVWAHVAASWYKLPSVRTYSGGTEVTECNPRTIDAFVRAGIEVESPEGANPIYVLEFGDEVEKLECFSKLYRDPPNPPDDYLAMMCCGHVDETCPNVEGATERYAIHYRDPKESDGTDLESTVYDERCRQIGTEMFYLMSLVSK